MSLRIVLSGYADIVRVTPSTTSTATSPPGSSAAPAGLDQTSLVVVAVLAVAATAALVARRLTRGIGT